MQSRISKIGLLLSFGLFATLNAVQAAELSSEPATLTLELNKTQYATGEPAYVKATINNQSGEDLVINLSHMFGINDHNFNNFRMNLVTPDGREIPYTGIRKYIFIEWAPSSDFYFLLPQGKGVTGELFLWWPFIMEDYRNTLENIPAGKYKLFATYKIPGPASYTDHVIYSDTLEFEFLPLEKEYMSSLQILDSLWNLMLCNELGTERQSELERLRSLDSPYREAMWAYSLAWVNDLNIFAYEKSRFDKLYPNSGFTPFILTNQCYFAKRSNQTFKADSINAELIKGIPMPLEMIRMGRTSDVKLVNQVEYRKKYTAMNNDRREQ